MAADDRGPLERVRDDELIWLVPGPTLRGIVGADLTVLTSSDAKLRAAADDIAHANGNGGDDGIGALIDEMTWQVGDLDGILNLRQLDDAAVGVAAFKDELADRGETVET